MSTLADRVKLAMAEKGCTLTELAAAAGVRPPSVSDWINGKTRSLKSAPAWRASKFLGVEHQWLTEGIGTMRKNVEHKLSGNVSTLVHRVAEPNQDERELLHGFREASQEVKEIMLDLARKASKKNDCTERGERND